MAYIWDLLLLTRFFKKFDWLLKIADQLILSGRMIEGKGLKNFHETVIFNVKENTRNSEMGVCVISPQLPPPCT